MQERKGISTLFEGIIITIIIVIILHLGKSIILPFMLAIFLSFILNPIVQLMVKRKIPLGLAVVLTILFTFLLLYLVGILVFASVKDFSTQLPFYETRIKDFLVNFSDIFKQNFEHYFKKPFDIQIFEKVDWLDAIQRYSITERVLKSVGTFLSFLLNIILIIVFVIYLLLGRSNLYSKIQRAFSKNHSQKIIRVIDNINSQVQIYLGTKTIVSFATALPALLLFYLFGLDFAILWAFIMFLFNFIPNIGSLISSLLPIIIALIQFDSYFKVFWLVVFLITIQFIVANLLEPRLMGRSLNLSPLMVIISLIFWGWLWGIVGMFIAVPILATLTIILENIESLKFISVFLRGHKNTNNIKSINP
jgi:AI-2 transport protein TqsA